jgi:TfoX/Sxy family transcriptional regulator of competence genes
MAYAKDLAERIMGHLANQPHLDQRKMFGGLSFMIQGTLCCGVIKTELCVRIGADAYDAALERPHVRPMDFIGKPMRAWVFVGPEALADDTELHERVDLGLRHALSLPAK